MAGESYGRSLRQTRARVSFLQVRANPQIGEHYYGGL